MPSYGSNGVRGDGSSANSGNQISARSSTRVHQQPGGNSSFSLGWGDPSNANQVVHKKTTYAPAPQGGGAAVFGTGGGGAPGGGYGGGYGQPAPYGGGGAAYGGNGGSYSGSDYVPKSLNTAPASGLHRGDSLESMAGPMGASPISRMRGGYDDGGYAQPGAVSPSVARAAAASSRRTGMGYSPTAADAFGARGDHVSSNSYASGANQNSGNVITDRSSTRVAQQPGGNSSFSLGWSAPDNSPARQQTGRRQIPQQQQQQQQQQQAFVYGQQAAPPQQQQPYQASAAPYGQSAGYGQSPPQQQQQGGGSYGQGVYAGGAPSNSGGFAFGANPDRERGSSNAFANGASQNTGNFISDRSSTRIHAPPGGRSSLTIG